VFSPPLTWRAQLQVEKARKVDDVMRKSGNDGLVNVFSSLGSRVNVSFSIERPLFPPFFVYFKASWVSQSVNTR